MKSLIKQSNGYWLAMISVLFLSVSLGDLNAQNVSSTTKSSELLFESTELDYGEIAQSADGNNVFKFTNSGNAPLLISKVNTSCGCTVADFPKQPILPGESGEIKVNYDTKRVGKFSKTITVISNATEPQLRLKIKGEVLKNSI